MYVGRFAPTPSGALHAGSLVAALASWLDARAHGGRWLVRIEDVDGPRAAPGAEQEILRQLHALGLVPDEPPLRQSTRGAVYASALQALRAADRAYPCGCTRREIEAELAAMGQPAHHAAQTVYPGTCRDGLNGKPARAWRLRCGDAVTVEWHDRRLGPQRQDVARSVGDFILQRADGPWAYQLAVVVDDAAQGITHVVRGEDLADNSARQIHLQRLLALPTPLYLHTPLVRDVRGDKLSKSKGAPTLDVTVAQPALDAAARTLGLIVAARDRPEDWLNDAVAAWAQRWTVNAVRPSGAGVVVATTPRLAIRPFTLDDAAFIVELLNDPDWLRFIGDRQVRSADDARDWLCNGPLASQARHSFALWAVVRHSDGATVGMCGLVRRDGLDDVDLGYAFLPTARGQGLAREAATAVLAHAFEAVRLQRVVAVTNPDNVASRRVLEAIGMRFERRLRLPAHDDDSLLYAAHRPLP